MVANKLILGFFVLLFLWWYIFSVREQNISVQKMDCPCFGGVINSELSIVQV